MQIIDLQTLEQEFDDYFRLVAEGETILITENGQVVAELSPPQPGRSAALVDP
jgi:antitoxin (DNA-binding transcriptional repressor) of toxin-antitoxin stability system